jgi:hypothetical protein
VIGARGDRRPTIELNLPNKIAGPWDRLCRLWPAAGSHALPAEGQLSPTWRMRRVESPEQNQKPLRIEPKRKCGGAARWQGSSYEYMTKVLQHVALHLLWELCPKAPQGKPKVPHRDASLPVPGWSRRKETMLFLGVSTQPSWTGGGKGDAWQPDVPSGGPIQCHHTSCWPKLPVLVETWLRVVKEDPCCSDACTIADPESAGPANGVI